MQKIAKKSSKIAIHKVSLSYMKNLGGNKLILKNSSRLSLVLLIFGFQINLRTSIKTLGFRSKNKSKINSFYT